MEKIKILHLEDFQNDSEIIGRTLKKGQLSFEMLLVNSRLEFVDALQNFCPDIILSDHALPQFNSFEALKIVRGKGLRIPFILVTGAVSEEFAAIITKEGADDYILKDRLERLPSAILNCLQKFNSEKAGREAQERLTLTINTLKDYAIFQLDTEGAILSCNTAAEKIVGFPVHEIIGKNIMNFYTEEDRKNGIAKYNLSMAIKNGRFETTGWRRRNDGSLFCADIVITALFDESNVLKGFAKITRDITSRRRAEEQTLNLLHSLQTKNRDLRQFAYLVSHNLRSPIAKILGLASIFKYATDTTEILDKIVEETINLDNVVKDMNAVITARDVEDEKTSCVNFYEEVKLIENVLEDQIREANAVVMCEFNPATITTVKGKFYSILFNLISNAVKYRSPKRSLIIYVKSVETLDEICLSVHDNGKGIDLTLHGDKMFMMYKRFHGDDIPGKGIGLNLIKAQVESLGGNIKIESTVDMGSIFKVYFRKNYKARINSQINQVFIIDDDKVSNSTNKRLLSKHLSVGKINVYENGLMAINELKRLLSCQNEEFPDLIFLDIEMPVMDGWAFLDAFENFPNSVQDRCKVIILSFSSNEEVIQRSKKFKTVYNFISKPFTPQKLLELISA